MNLMVICSVLMVAVNGLYIKPTNPNHGTKQYKNVAPINTENRLSFGRVRRQLNNNLLVDKVAADNIQSNGIVEKINIVGTANNAARRLVDNVGRFGSNFQAVKDAGNTGGFVDRAGAGVHANNVGFFNDVRAGRVAAENVGGGGQIGLLHQGVPNGQWDRLDGQWGGQGRQWGAQWNGQNGQWGGHIRQFDVQNGPWGGYNGQLDGQNGQWGRQNGQRGRQNGHWGGQNGQWGGQNGQWGNHIRPAAPNVQMLGQIRKWAQQLGNNIDIIQDQINMEKVGLATKRKDDKAKNTAIAGSARLELLQENGPVQTVDGKVAGVQTGEVGGNQVVVGNLGAIQRKAEVNADGIQGVHAGNTGVQTGDAGIARGIAGGIQVGDTGIAGGIKVGDAGIAGGIKVGDAGIEGGIQVVDVGIAGGVQTGVGNTGDRNADGIPVVDAGNADFQVDARAQVGDGGGTQTDIDKAVDRNAGDSLIVAHNAGGAQVNAENAGDPNAGLWDNGQWTDRNGQWDNGQWTARKWQWGNQNWDNGQWQDQNNQWGKRRWV